METANINGADPALKYTFKVRMTCSGCSSAVTRVLTRLVPKEVTSFEVNLEDQSVIVVPGSMSLQDVKAKIDKTGKEVLEAREDVV